MNESRRRVGRKLAGAAAVFMVALGAGTAVLLGHPALEAQFGDSVLRPLLGAERVIALENVVFGAQDKLNQLDKKKLTTADYRQEITPVTRTMLPDTAPLPTGTPALVLAPITPVLTTADSLAGEGQWSLIAGTAMRTTFIRTDTDRPYSVVNLVYIPMSDISIGLMAGTKFPGGPAGPGKVPSSVQASGKLLAAFNGGFQQSDGHYGMEVDGVTYVPMRPNMPVVRIFSDGHADLVPYDGKPFPPDVVAARENGPLLVQDGKVSPETEQGGIDRWGGTADASYITWRSGLGLMPNGDLVYAVGDSLTAASLATALQLAGAQNALQLDINPFWVRFMIYTWNQPTSSYSWSRLIPALADGGAPYLKGYEKDFFYLSSK